MALQTSRIKAGTQEFNFGSGQAAMVRWNAAIAAHGEFIATDQYEDGAKAISSHH
jgi:hypothetical protein